MLQAAQLETTLVWMHYNPVSLARNVAADTKTARDWKVNPPEDDSQKANSENRLKNEIFGNPANFGRDHIFQINSFGVEIVTNFKRTAIGSAAPQLHRPP